jgi:hypothetical protein
VINELPFLAFCWLLAATLLAFGQSDIDSAGGWVVFGLAVLTSVCLGSHCMARMAYGASGGTGHE